MHVDNSRQEDGEADEGEDRQSEEHGQPHQSRQEPGQPDGQMAPADDQEPLECAICRDGLKAPTELDCCAHTFCFECIVRWTEEKKICPVCRRPTQLALVQETGVVVAFNPLTEEARDEDEAAEEEFPAFDVDPGGADEEDEAAEEAPILVIVEPPRPRRRRHVHVPLVRVLTVIWLIILIVSLLVPLYIPPSTHSLYPVKAGYR
ncbi:hypothetical protein AAVH_20243 [Aphelenchoides avenae]|nr:hypothetical protein AAVH_20243 [Aphelenchus avenae]